ncbi:MAG: UDP-N-acetylmuramoyl-tripeptide--D-alanyl-D-alanine ligase [Thermodesulfobacteriota bacterium]
MKLSLFAAARAIKAIGDFDNDERLVLTGVSTDSRGVKKGDLFFCLSGEQFDGHNFARDAARRGAGAVVAHQPLPDVDDIPVLLVRDTLSALGELALFWRHETRARVIGITGSAGKTTTKELLFAALREQGKTGRNYKNFNNQIGLPLSMLAFDGDEDFWLLELGINNFQDMHDLGSILRPDIAVFVNVGPCHLQGLEDKSGVARAKTVLLDYMHPGSLCLANSDYPELVREVESRSHLKKVWFGRQEEMSSCTYDYAGNENGRGRYRIQLQKEKFDLILPFFGQHLAESVAAAFCTAAAAGVPGSEIEKGMADVQVPEKRMKSRKIGNWLILDDSYNANPLSMRGAIRAATEIANKENLILVLGEMGELGGQRKMLHEKLGAWITESGCMAAYFCGRSYPDVADGMGLDKSKSLHPINSLQDFAQKLKEARASGGVILFKGSRSCQMEKYMNKFISMPEINKGEI